MKRNRLSLVNYDVLRELCIACENERFHFVPIGSAVETGACDDCGSERHLAEVSESAIARLITQPERDVVIVPLPLSA
jgi:NMD protein affecting ribosome stability and mRNA decay